MSDLFDEQPQPNKIPYPVSRVNLELGKERFIHLSKVMDELDEERKKGQEEIKKLLLDFLEISDTLDRILSLVTGESITHETISIDPRLRRSLVATHKLFMLKLKKYNVRPMELVGSLFDSSKADAVDNEVQNDLPEETVLREVIRGYYWGDQVLRRAQVVVSAKST